MEMENGLVVLLLTVVDGQEAALCEDVEGKLFVQYIPHEFVMPGLLVDSIGAHPLEILLPGVREHLQRELAAMPAELLDEFRQGWSVDAV